MPWAAHSAELRLWLQLIVETELSAEELRKKPLLPNLNLNIRAGDSLVQEIGGMSLHFRTTNISERLRKKLNALKAEKGKYFLNLLAKFSKREEFFEEETRVFEEIIEDRINTLINETRILKAKIERFKSTKQFNLYGDVPESEQKRLFDERMELEDSLIKLEAQIETLKSIRGNLKHPEKKPFVWDIDFAEIFGDKGGFDIVIGNPPYVRQEKISPPNRLKTEVSLQDRKEYKGKLIKSVQSCFQVIEGIDRKSDYYVYFYFHGLSLLNKNGTFCFITSNSWLDIEFGKELQEFILKYVPIEAIYDSPKRSFKHSAINTVISIFHAPQLIYERFFGLEFQKGFNWPANSSIAKFIMFKKPISEVISSKNLIDIDIIRVKSTGESITDFVKNLVKKDDYRVFPVIQEDLMEDGWEYPEDYDKKRGRFKAGGYEGNKWGGKYLRAPDIFYTILEKGKDYFIELGKIAKIRRGFTAGANEFFYLDEEAQNKFMIEREYLKPVIKSPKECEAIIVDPKKLKFKVFLCDKPKNELRGTNALKYIDWGENQIAEIKSGGDKGKKVKGYHRLETVKNRKLWYSLGKPKLMNFIFRRFFNEIFNLPVLETHAFVDQTFYGGNFDDISKLSLSLNCTVSSLLIELLGRYNLGEGLLQYAVYEANRIIIFNPKKIQAKNIRILRRKINPIFEELGVSIFKPIREQEPKPLPDRVEIDKIIFDELGLTKEERKEVYYAVCELVKDRLDKAKSLKGD
jgi:hypothetical protein